MTPRKLGNADSPVDVHAIGACTFTRNLTCAVAAAALAVSVSTAGQELQPLSNDELAAPFDTPLRIEIVDLGASPYYPAGADSPPTALSCYYFPDFMVKEHYLGGRGAEWLSILLEPGEPPECKGSHERGERVIEYPEWEGHFKGAKGSLVFFDASDSVNGGLPFAIYDASNGRKIFQDSAYFGSASSSSEVNVVSTGAGYSLEYVRVAGADCDLHSEGIACWTRIKAAHSLQSDDMPICTGYEHIADLIGTEQVESVIAYAVEVTLSPFPAIRSVAGSISCWPAH